MNAFSSFKSLLLMSVIVIITLNGCQSFVEPVPASPENAYRNEVPQGYAVPQIASELTAGMSDSLSSYIEMASKLSGSGLTDRHILSGTLTLPLVSGDAYTYQPGPSDRFRVVYPDGSVTDFVVTTYSRPHNSTADQVTNFQMMNGKGLDVTIRDTRNANHTVRMIDGNFTRNGTVYTENLTEEGSANDLTVTGTISGAGTVITVNERRFEDRKYDGSVVCTRQLENSWTSGNNQYRINSGLVRSSFIGGRPDSRPDGWNASGSLTGNGAAFGELRCRIQGAAVIVFTDTPAGQVVLGTWNL